MLGMRQLRFIRRLSENAKTSARRGFGGGTYYDSQSAYWVTPHDPKSLKISVDVSASRPDLDDGDALLTPIHQRHEVLKDLAGSYQTIVLPASPFLQNNNNLAAHASLVGERVRTVVKSIHPYSSSVSAPTNVLFDVEVDCEDGGDVKEKAVQHVRDHFERGNRVRATLRGLSAGALQVGNVAGVLADAGAEEIFLDNGPGTDCNDLVAAIEEVCYVDAPGGAMVGRLGLNFVDDDEFWEEAVEAVGVAKLKVKEEDIDLLRRRIADGITCDVCSQAFYKEGKN